MSETIPEAIMAEARTVLLKVDMALRKPSRSDAANHIAQAILDAEKRGADRERERAAEIAETAFGSDDSVMEQFIARAIASAIRKGA